MFEDLTFRPRGSVMPGEKLEPPGRLRAKLCLGLLLIGFAAVAAKLVVVQIFEHDDWVRRVDEQRKTSVKMYPSRGTIYDRKHIPLATSVVREILCVVPGRVKNKKKFAHAIAPFANMSPRKVLEKINNPKLKLVYLRRDLDMDEVRQIQALNLDGIEFRSEHSRQYPKGALAANVMGIANFENRGLEGIEYKYNNHLAGVAGRRIVIKDNTRREITALTQIVEEPQDGDDIVLTIDEMIQYISEKALDDIVRSYAPESATAIVLDPKTGEVLAMASRPTFDPDDSSTFTPERLRNRVIIDTFEPGSAFKAIAAAAALERNVISPEDYIYCELGSMRYHGHTYNDVHPLGEVSFAEVIAQSSNIGTIKAVGFLEPEEFYSSIRTFGFGQLARIDLPGESIGLLRHPSRWSGLSMGSIPIGQEIGVTALQLAVAFSTIANGGTMMRPYSISAVLDPDGDILKETGPQYVRRVIRPDTAKKLTKMLEGVIKVGTGDAAKVDGYRCAGKTGTAQKINPKTGKYYKDRYVAVFAGFVPTDDPVACIVIAADSPKGRRYYGGQVAAPAFAKMAKEILNYYEIPPTAPAEQQKSEPNKSSPNKKKPVDNSRIARVVASTFDGSANMPDVRGMTMTAILDLFEKYPVQFEFEGSGVAIRQSPAPGRKIEEGRRCRIAFKRVNSK